MAKAKKKVKKAKATGYGELFDVNKNLIWMLPVLLLVIWVFFVVYNSSLQ